MFRRWIRALARTGSPGRPFPVPPKTGRHPRTLLRLEAVEDRTLASISAVEPPKFHTTSGAHAGTPSKPAPATPSDDQSQTTSDASDQTGSQHDLGPNAAAADTPVLMAGGFNLGAAADIPTQVPNVRAALDVRSASELNFADESSSPPTKSQTDTETNPPGVSVGTDSGGPAAGASTAGQAPVDRAAASNARAPSDVSPAPVTTPQPGRRNDAATGAVARAATVEPDPVTSKGGRANGTSAAVSASAAVKATIPADLSDGALLQRFVTNREEAAFTALVRRYAPVVLGVCQRVLGDFHAAQDASQATFIVLARKAGMLDRTSPLGGWLYKVAYHLALRSRGVAAKQRLGERAAAPDEAPATNDTADFEQQEVNQILREELQGLPEKYRAPLALVYIDGRSHADAAQAIGLPRGSMAKRVGEGLDRLRERLVHRGISL